MWAVFKEAWTFWSGMLPSSLAECHSRLLMAFNDVKHCGTLFRLIVIQVGSVDPESQEISGALEAP